MLGVELQSLVLIWVTKGKAFRERMTWRGLREIVFA
jgi:hypothetical protein